MAPPQGHIFYIGNVWKMWKKIFLSETTGPKALIFVASPTKFVQIFPLGPKMAGPGDQIFYIGLYRENVKKSSCLKPQSLEL